MLWGGALAWWGGQVLFIVDVADDVINGVPQTNACADVPPH